MMHRNIHHLRVLVPLQPSRAIHQLRRLYQDSKSIVVIPKFTFPRFPRGYLFAFEVVEGMILKVTMIGPGIKISNLLLKNCVSEIDNNSINNHRSIMILTLLNSGRQGLSNGTIIRPNFVVREKSKNNLWLRPPGAVPAAEAADSAPVARG